MISDEPDEDADTLDDDSVLETCFDPSAAKTEAREQTARNRGVVATHVRDWPQSCTPEADFGLDPETLAWFKANHADWRLAIGSVLRGWVAAKSASAKL
jgi:hypothetical protein